MATKTIGTGAGLNVTPDFADLNAWDAYMNALGAFAADETGRVLWASSANEIVHSASQTLDGSTPGTFSIILEAGDLNGAQGGSFVNHANKLTNALRYNPSNGAALRMGVGSGGKFQFQDPNIKVRNLQFKTLSTNDMSANNTADAGRTLTQCIFFQASGSGDVAVMQLRDMVATNCLFYTNSAGPTQYAVITLGASNSLVNCTLAALSGVAAPLGVSLGATASIFTNTAVVGFTADISGSGASGSNNATTLSSGASALPTNGRQTDLVATTEFFNITAGTEDFRLATTSTKLRNNGTATGAPATDIVGTTRPL